jgi:glycerol-3-phosphate dehydrogenase subunit C
MKYRHKHIIDNNFEQCIKCTICTVYCPMLEVNPLYPGPKQAGPDGERYRLKEPQICDEAIKYCLNCKRCEVSCPSGVRIGDMIAIAKAESRHGHSVRDRLLSGSDSMGGFVATFAPAINRALESKVIKGIMDGCLAIDQRRTMPKYASERFSTWFRKYAESKQEGFSKHITYFHGSYVNCNYPELGKEFVEILNAVGYGVKLMDDERYCGIAKISSGLLHEAEKDARRNIVAIRKSVAEGRRVIATSPSCAFVMRDEYEYVLGIENADVRDKISLSTRFLYRLWERGEIKLAFKKDYHSRVAYHASCHMERLGWVLYSTALLRLIPGLEVVMLPSQCCGMAGFYGYKKENYDFSQAIGEKLFEKIRSTGVERVVTDCETCKWQIEMSMGLEVLNPISILAEAIDFEKTRELNGQK